MHQQALFKRPKHPRLIPEHRQLLRHVSRSFDLSIRLLPGALQARVATREGAASELHSLRVVSVIQSDAIERKGLTQLLFEPETLKSVQPNLQLVGTLMSLKGRIPERTKETARMVDGGWRDFFDVRGGHPLVPGFLIC